ncbi:hypothetical protein Spiaf_1657 [Spirochaeta africana DSM 8902]|uniref:Uncharacterized protein n=2 Tax=Spirochaeta TaxID=146 RepID=H9UJM2_SPIAZ|nr:hypothetical protein Spiaf_1657 [Spirochaeta africana DSM 8902]
MRRLSLLILLLLISSLPLTADAPEPYHPDEFPQWALDLRRGSVITLGAVPVTLLVSRMFYDIGRFGLRSFEQGQVAGEYAPLFFAPPDGVPLDDTDRTRILAIGVSAAAIIAVIDYYLGVRERRE